MKLKGKPGRGGRLGVESGRRRQAGEPEAAASLLLASFLLLTQTGFCTTVVSFPATAAPS